MHPLDFARAMPFVISLVVMIHSGVATAIPESGLSSLDAERSLLAEEEHEIEILLDRRNEGALRFEISPNLSRESAMAIAGELISELHSDPLVDSRMELLLEEIAASLLALARLGPLDRNPDGRPRGIPIDSLQAAEHRFVREIERRSAAEGSSDLELARLHRHCGRLVGLYSVGRADRFFQEATRLDPSDVIAWHGLGAIYLHLANPTKAVASLQSALDNLDSDDTGERRAFVLEDLGIALETSGKLDEAESHYRRVREIYQDRGDMNYVATVDNHLGSIYKRRGNLDRAISLHQRALARFEESGRANGMASTLNHLGLIMKARGRFEEAEQMHLRAMEKVADQGPSTMKASHLNNLAILYRIRGEYERAEATFFRADKIYRLHGRAGARANTLNELGILAGLRGDPAESKRLHEEALSKTDDFYLKIGSLTNIAIAQEGADEPGPGLLVRRSTMGGTENAA